MTDIKQAVKELREALARYLSAFDEFKKAASDESRWLEFAASDEHDLTTAMADTKSALFSLVIGSLPAVLDRLEELEREKTDLQSRYDRRINAHDKDGRALMRIAAQRDAIRAKFAEFREAVDQWVGMGSEADEDDVSALQRIRSRFPALDSSGDETEEGREG